MESPEEIHEYGPEGSVSLLSGIWLTQVGDPRGHGTKGGTNGISTDRVVTEPVAVISDGEDEEVGDSSLGTVDITEGWLEAKAGGEGGPVVEDAAARANSLAGVGAEGELQSSREVSAVAVAGDRWSSFLGVG